MTNANEIKVGDLVLVTQPKSGADGYEGDWYVHEICGHGDLGLAKNAFADFATVYINRQRIVPA